MSQSRKSVIRKVSHKRPTVKNPSLSADAMSMLSGSYTCNKSFTRKKFPATINFETLESVIFPSFWGTTKGAKAAAGFGAPLEGRLIGFVEIEVKLSESTAKSLSEENNIPASDFEDTGPFDSDGEFSTPTGQIPVTRIIDGECAGSLELSDDDKALVNYILALQSPCSSPWNRPFIRVISNHLYHPARAIMAIQFYIYFSRLIFELIADEAIKYVVSRIRGIPVTVIPTEPLRRHSQRPMFTTSLRTKASSPSYRFSLPGLLNYAESQGYDITSQQPDQLSVELLEYQLSTYQWMLDQERDSRGLNACFWEEWQCQDGGGFMYYFPLAGEFRLTRPPTTRGGLLCEEMGLGKTVEIISLILGNPFRPSSPPETTRILTKATLIVVPPTLVSQWLSELHKRVKPPADGSGRAGLDIINLSGLKQKIRQETLIVVPEDSFVDDGILSFHLQGNDDTNFLNRFFDGAEVSFKPSWGAQGRVYSGVYRSRCRHKRGFHIVRVQIDQLVSESDVVLTTYETLRDFGSFYTNYRWHRIVLDECQEIKAATNKVASMCANLEASSRWMVSGTPLCSKLEDLHGELKFLQIWPFCLGDAVDGFWEAKIGRPYHKKDEESLRLLHALIDAVMMRHCKSQTYLSGSPLIKIPNRTIEWRAFFLQNDSEIFLHHYLESFAACALAEFIRHLGHTNAQILNFPHFAQVRGLSSLVSRCITFPGCIQLVALDHLRRLLLSQDAASRQLIGGVDGGLPKVAPEVILRMMQATGLTAVGGMNHDTSRVRVNVAEAEALANIKKEYGKFSIRKLKELLEKQDIPIPIISKKLSFMGTIKHNAVTLEVILSNDNSKKTDGEESRDTEARLFSHYVKKDDILRIAQRDRLDFEVQVLAVKDTVKGALVTCSTLWMNDTQIRAPLYVRGPPSNKKAYIDLLVSKHQAYRGIDHGGNLHELGFATLYQLMGGHGVDCPLCLSQAVRPTVTRCVHVFCFACINDVLQRDAQYPKCPVCRRRVSLDTLLEVDQNCVVEDANGSGDDRDEQDGSGDGQAWEQQLMPDWHIASSSSSSSSGFAPSKTLCDTAFVIPPLSTSSTAPLPSELQALPYPRVARMVPRDRLLPSLDSLVLTHFACFGSYSKITSRVAAVLCDMLEVVKEDPHAKFVVFSQYPDTLEAFSKMLVAFNIAEEGNVPVRFLSVIATGRGAQSAAEALSRFSDDPACNLCLLGTGAAAAGLTLTMARVCYMLEPHSNAAAEAQALNRVHRIGQAHNVRCVVFFAGNTCEERLLALRQQQGSLTEVLLDQDGLALLAQQQGHQGQQGSPTISGAQKKRKRDISDDDDDSNYSHGKESDFTRYPRAFTRKQGASGEGIFFSIDTLSVLYGVTDGHKVS